MDLSWSAWWSQRVRVVKRTLNQRSANFSVKGQMINTSCFAGLIFFFVLFLQTFKNVKTFLTTQVI